MAIKVKHEGNVASRIVGSAEGGRGKRAAEDARAFAQIAAQENIAANRQLQGAHAGPVSPGHASPGGGGYAHAGGAPGIMSPPAPARGGISGGGVRRAGGGSGSSASGGGTDAGGDYKVTGTSIFSRPDVESRWDPGNGGRWIRPWQPGEKEAEARARVGAVEERFQIDREDRALQGKKDLAEFQYTQKQRQQYAGLQDIRDALLNSGRYSKDDIDAMMPEIEMRMNGIRDNPERMLPQDRRPVPELQISPDGRFYFDDAGGKWTPMQREQTQGAAGPTPEQSYKLRELGAAQKSYQDELRAWKRAKADYDNGSSVESPGPMPEFDVAAELQRIGGMWDSVVGQQAPADASQIQPLSQPQPQPGADVQTPNPQAIQSVGPDATPEQKAENWAARLRKQ